MKKRITSVLLTLVMLLSLVPTMGTTAFAAETESHPTAVGELTKGKEACYYRIYPDGTGKTVTWLGYGQAPSNDATTSWNYFKEQIGENYKGDTSKKIDGVAYYDQDSGTLYVKGCFVSTCTKVTPSTPESDVLTVVVDEDTIGDSGWYIDEAKKCLKELNIEFRNNSTLTFTKLDNNNKTATILGVTGHEIIGDVREENRPVYNAGNLALTGSGTLKIDIPNDAGVLYCIRARSVSIKDNVSLDIKTVGNTYTVAHESQRTVRSAAFYCYEKLNIDTTGTVNIVAEKAKPNEDDRGSFNAFSNINADRFNLVNAQSVTLNVVNKEDTFINDNGQYQQSRYDAVKSKVKDNGWTVTESADTATPYTVTMTPAGLSDAVLKVGSQEFQRTGAITEGNLQADGSKQSLSIQVKEPAWLKTLYNANRVDYNCTAAVYENGTKLSEDFALSWGGGTSTLSLTLRGDFKPTAGKSYIVTFSITPTVKATGEKLTDYATSGNWLLTAVEKKTEITSVNLTGDALKEGDTNGPTLTGSGTSYTVKTVTPWNITGSAAAGKEYYTNLFVKAADGYVFPTDGDQLRSIISVKLGNTPVRKLGISLTEDAKTLVLAVYAIPDHVHNWGAWKPDEDCHYRECTTCKAVSDRIPHNWGNWMNNDEDTDKRTCSDCGYSETRAKPERPISFLKINIIRPVAGAASSVNDLTIRDAYTEQVEIVPNSVGWYDESGNPVTGNFVKGQTYTIKARFTPKGERTFADTITTAGLFFTLNETKTLSTDKKIVDYSCTFTAYESVTVDTALPTLVIGEAMPLPTVADGHAYSVVVMYNAGGLASLSYDSTEGTWKGSNTEVTGDNLKVKADTVYYYSCTIKKGENEEITVNLTGTGNSTNPTVSGNGVSANYDTTAMNKVTSVELTVTAPAYGATPADNATVPEGANYNAGTPEWSPAVTDGKFGADTYTVKIPVAAANNYSFAKGCVYTVNGYTATYADGKVSYTFPALTAPHEHTYGDWAKLDDSSHSRTCTAGDDIQVEAHTWGSWTTVDGNTHKRTCTTEGCDAEQTANHNWVFDSQVDATFTAPGKTVYKCADNCGVANKEEPIAQLVKIDVATLTVAKPVKDAAAAEATTTDTAYYVAATEWVAADGTVLDITNGGKFQPGTVYTVKITLETAGDGVFSAASAYNQIAGKTATVSPALTGDNYTGTVVLTYTFDATEGNYVPTAPSITTTALPDGKVGEAYNQLLSANGSAPITWSVESGNLPDGLTLVGDTIKGTPSKAGNFTFTVKATNAGGSATKELTIKITDTEAAKYHNVIITGAGTNATGAGSHAAGTTVNIYAGTKSGYTFDGWTSDDVTILSASSKNASFVMPDKAVTVKANWIYNGGGSGGGGYTYYTIKATAGVNGSISPSGNVSVREGRDQTFTITPDKGYAVSKVLIDSKNVGAVKSYTFENVKKNHTIEVVFMKAGGNPQTGVFVDVPEDSYYEEAVNWAVENGITTGTDATHFTPDGICTRAQSVTFLWRAAGSPAPKSTTMPFTDVKAGSYYYDAVLWAVENGITKGTSATEFSPAQNCSRAQIVTFLWRSEKSPAAGAVNPFTDVKSDAYYADAVLWAVKEDVTKGTTSTTFSPDANCTRAQIVTFIWRALAE